MTQSKYKAFAGTFHVAGYSPDGDSIRFEPSNVAAFTEFLGIKTRRDRKYQLRLEAIDALETHYEGFRQPRVQALSALERLLEGVDISDIKYSLADKEIVLADDAKQGFVLTRSVDVFKRPVVYVFGNTAHDLEDTRAYEASEVSIESSVNFQMAAKGYVYPTFYNTMDSQFLATFQTAFKVARENRVGLWFNDKSFELPITGIHQLETDVIIFPKLFRRLVKFASRYSDWDEFPAYIKKNGGSVVVEGQDIGEGFWRHIDYDADSNVIRLLTNPEELIFKPKK